MKMTKYWTLTFIITSCLIISCGNDDRKQLTGIDKPANPAPTQEEIDKALVIKSIDPTQTKVELILAAGDIKKESQIDENKKVDTLAAHMNESNAFTGFIINAIDTDAPFRGNIMTLSLTPTDEADLVKVNIVTGRGENYNDSISLDKQPNILHSEYTISLHQETDCLILKKTNKDYTAVVCKSTPPQKVEKTDEIVEKKTEEKVEETTEEKNEEQNIENKTGENK